MNLANRLTILRVALIPLFVWAALIDEPMAQMAAMALFLLASLTDFVDGYIARSRNIVTDFGKFMDPIADKMLVMAALVTLTSQGRAHPVCVMLLLAREFIVSAIRMLAAGKGVVIAAGPLGKAKTVLQMIAITLVLFPFTQWSWITGLGQALLWASAVLSTWSLVDYILRNREVITP